MLSFRGTLAHFVFQRINKDWIHCCPLACGHETVGIFVNPSFIFSYKQDGGGIKSQHRIKKTSMTKPNANVAAGASCRPRISILRLWMLHRYVLFSHIQLTTKQQDHFSFSTISEPWYRKWWLVFIGVRQLLFLFFKMSSSVDILHLLSKPLGSEPHAAAAASVLKCQAWNSLLSHN